MLADGLTNAMLDALVRDGCRRRNGGQWRGAAADPDHLVRDHRRRAEGACWVIRRRLGRISGGASLHSGPLRIDEIPTAPLSITR
jgi:hypothetical protein